MYHHGDEDQPKDQRQKKLAAGEPLGRKGGAKDAGDRRDHHAAWRDPAHQDPFLPGHAAPDGRQTDGQRTHQQHHGREQRERAPVES